MEAKSVAYLIYAATAERVLAKLGSTLEPILEAVYPFLCCYLPIQSTYYICWLYLSMLSERNRDTHTTSPVSVCCFCISQLLGCHLFFFIFIFFLIRVNQAIFCKWFFLGYIGIYSKVIWFNCNIQPTTKELALFSHGK